MTDIPTIMYGTAWKEDATEGLVTEALKAGYRAIDTANQRMHYHEAGVGAALARAFDDGLTRDDIFIQTKFTHIRGQDHRLPYDPEAPFATQVRQSFQSSLEHLHIDRLDSYVLHGPSTRQGLTDGDWEVWSTMEALHDEGLTTYIGLSNVTAEQLALVCSRARVTPRFVQNRCFAQLGWDKEAREVAREHDVIYQGFSLLTANTFIPRLIRPITARVGKTPAQVVFRFAQQIGILPLTGTTDPTHMREDLDLDFDLSDDEVQAIETIALR